MVLAGFPKQSLINKVGAETDGQNYLALCFADQNKESQYVCLILERSQKEALDYKVLGIKFVSRSKPQLVLDGSVSSVVIPASSEVGKLAAAATN